jgi:hypothetical protein
VRLEEKSMSAKKMAVRIAEEMKAAGVRVATVDANRDGVARFVVPYAQSAFVESRLRDLGFGAVTSMPTGATAHGLRVVYGDMPRPVAE